MNSSLGGSTTLRRSDRAELLSSWDNKAYLYFDWPSGKSRFGSEDCIISVRLSYP